MANVAKDAIIAGGGIAGLATAIALAQRGIVSKVFERRATFPEEGAGIQIGPNGTRILKALGVADFLKDSIAAPDAVSVRDGRTARELTRLSLGTWIAERHGAPYWTAHRRDLHGALRRRAEAEPLITLATGVEIQAFDEEPLGIRVIASDGHIFNASILIAADGLWSRLRGPFAGDVAPRPVGKTAFRTVVTSADVPTDLAPNTIHIWLAPGAHAVHYPVNSGRDIALIVIANDGAVVPEWDTPAGSEIVREKISAFAAPLQYLLRASSDWRQWSLCDMPALARWTSRRAALVGDAAHPILPFLAQGAVMALEDAVTLAAHLADESKDAATALRGYERVRQARVDRVAHASRRNGRIYQLQGTLALARNGVLRMAPPERMLAGLDWLYGWRL